MYTKEDLFVNQVPELNTVNALSVQAQDPKQKPVQIQILMLAPAISPLEGGVGMTITCSGLIPDKDAIELRINGARCAFNFDPEKGSIQFISPKQSSLGYKTLEVSQHGVRGVLEDVLVYADFRDNKFNTQTIPTSNTQSQPIPSPNNQNTFETPSNRKRWGK